MRLQTRAPDVIYLRRRPLLVSSVGGLPGEGGASTPPWLPKPEVPAPSPMPKPEGDPVPPRPLPRPVSRRPTSLKQGARGRCG